MEIGKFVCCSLLAISTASQAMDTSPSRNKSGIDKDQAKVVAALMLAHQNVVSVNSHAAHESAQIDAVTVELKEITSKKPVSGLAMRRLDVESPEEQFAVFNKSSAEKTLAEEAPIALSVTPSSCCAEFYEVPKTLSSGDLARWVMSPRHIPQSPRGIPLSPKGVPQSPKGITSQDLKGLSRQTSRCSLWSVEEGFGLYPIAVKSSAAQ